MERGYLKIEESSDKQFVVTAQLVDSTVWLTKHEIADLFNVFVNTIGNNIRYLFKSGLLCKEVVTRIQKTEINGCYSETIYYFYFDRLGFCLKYALLISLCRRMCLWMIL